MGNGVSLPEAEKLTEEEERAVLDYECSVEAIANFISSNRCQRIVLMTGAGVSVSAGIPDFRTPGTGLYDNLQRYNLPKPEAIFDINFFRQDPRPFYDLARDLLPANYTPTATHLFVRLLEKKGLLHRCYTQNIDTLERRAGINPELLVEAHGSFGSAHCTREECKKAFSQAYFCEQLLASGKRDEATGEMSYCVLCDAEGCGGFVKPDITFFGEPLPSRFFDLRQQDMESADLCIVIGTSLQVAPFCHLLHMCSPRTPRLLINLERVGEVTRMSNGNGFLFDRPNNYRDVELLSTCDVGVCLLCEKLGWLGELEELMKEFTPSFAMASLFPPSSPETDALRAVVTRNQRNDLLPACTVFNPHELLTNFNMDDLDDLPPEMRSAVMAAMMQYARRDDEAAEEENEDMDMERFEAGSPLDEEGPRVQVVDEGEEGGGDDGGEQ